MAAARKVSAGPGVLAAQLWCSSYHGVPLHDLVGVGLRNPLNRRLVVSKSKECMAFEAPFLAFDHGVAGSLERTHRRQALANQGMC